MILGTTNIDYVCLHGNGLPNEKRAGLATSCRVRQQNLPSRANTSSMSIKIRLSFRLLLRKNLSKEIIVLFLRYAHRLACKIVSIYTNRFPDNRLAIVAPRTPDARSAQSKVVIIRFQSYVPTLRCRRAATTQLQTFGKGKKIFAHPSWSKDFITK